MFFYLLATYSLLISHSHFSTCCPRWGPKTDARDGCYVVAGVAAMWRGGALRANAGVRTPVGLMPRGVPVAQLLRGDGWQSAMLHVGIGITGQGAWQRGRGGAGLGRRGRWGQQVGGRRRRGQPQSEQQPGGRWLVLSEGQLPLTMAVDDCSGGGDGDKGVLRSASAPLDC